MADKDTAGAAAAKEPRTIKSLNEAWGWRGKIYGPGADVVVPGDFPEDIEERDAATLESPTRAYIETARPGTSGSKVEQTDDIVFPDGTVSTMNKEQYAAELARRQAQGATGNKGDEEDNALPRVADLEDALKSLDNDEVRDMQARDERVSAQAIYERRLAE